MHSYILDDNGRKMVEDNLELVSFVVYRYFCSTGMELEDLISIGNIGLCQAAATYNPDLNIKFSTYAGRCIINAIKRAKRKHEPDVLSLNEKLFDDGGDCQDEYIDALEDRTVDVEEGTINKIICESIMDYVPTFNDIVNSGLDVPEYARAHKKSRQGVYSKMEREFRRARLIVERGPEKRAMRPNSVRCGVASYC